MDMDEDTLISLGFSVGAAILVVLIFIWVIVYCLCCRKRELHWTKYHEEIVREQFRYFTNTFDPKFNKSVPTVSTINSGRSLPQIPSERSSRSSRPRIATPEETSGQNNLGYTPTAEYTYTYCDDVPNYIAPDVPKEKPSYKRVSSKEAMFLEQKYNLRSDDTDHAHDGRPLSNGKSSLPSTGDSDQDEYDDINNVQFKRSVSVESGPILIKEKYQLFGPAMEFKPKSMTIDNETYVGSNDRKNLADSTPYKKQVTSDPEDSLSEANKKIQLKAELHNVEIDKNEYDYKGSQPNLRATSYISIEAADSTSKSSSDDTISQPDVIMSAPHRDEQQADVIPAIYHVTCEENLTVSAGRDFSKYNMDSDATNVYENTDIDCTNHTKISKQHYGHGEIPLSDSENNTLLSISANTLLSNSSDIPVDTNNLKAIEEISFDLSIKDPICSMASTGSISHPITSSVAKTNSLDGLSKNPTPKPRTFRSSSVDNLSYDITNDLSVDTYENLPPQPSPRAHEGHRVESDRPSSFDKIMDCGSKQMIEV